MNNIQIAKGLTYFKVEVIGHGLATQPATIKRLMAKTDSYFDDKDQTPYCVFQEVDSNGAAINKSFREDMLFWHMNDTVRGAKVHLFDSPELAVAFAAALDLEKDHKIARIREDAIANNLILLEEMVPGFVFHCSHVIESMSRTYVESFEVVSSPVFNEVVGSYFVLVRNLNAGHEVSRSLCDMSIGELNSHNKHRSFRQLREAEVYVDEFNKTRTQLDLAHVWSSFHDRFFDHTRFTAIDLDRRDSSSFFMPPQRERLPKRPHGKNNFKQNPSRNTGPKTGRW
jgi:hypothetical protein